MAGRSAGKPFSPLKPREVKWADGEIIGRAKEMVLGGWEPWRLTRLGIDIQFEKGVEKAGGPSILRVFSERGRVSCLIAISIWLTMHSCVRPGNFDETGVWRPGHYNGVMEPWTGHPSVCFVGVYVFVCPKNGACRPRSGLRLLQSSRNAEIREIAPKRLMIYTMML